MLPLIRFLLLTIIQRSYSIQYYQEQPQSSIVHNLRANFKENDLQDNYYETEKIKDSGRVPRDVYDYSEEQLDKDSIDTNDAELNLFSWWKGLPNNNRSNKTDGGHGRTQNPKSEALSTSNSPPSGTSVGSESTVQDSVVSVKDLANSRATVASTSKTSATANSQTGSSAAVLADSASTTISSTYQTACYTVTDACSQITVVNAPICTGDSGDSGALPARADNSSSTVLTSSSGTAKATTAKSGTKTSTAPNAVSAAINAHSSDEFINYAVQALENSVTNGKMDGVIIPIYQIPQVTPSSLIQNTKNSQEEKHGSEIMTDSSLLDKQIKHLAVSEQAAEQINSNSPVINEIYNFGVTEYDISSTFKSQDLFNFNTQSGNIEESTQVAEKKNNLGDENEGNLLPKLVQNKHKFSDFMRKMNPTESSFHSTINSINENSRYVGGKSVDSSGVANNFRLINEQIESSSKSSLIQEEKNIHFSLSTASKIEEQPMGETNKLKVVQSNTPNSNTMYNKSAISNEQVNETIPAINRQMHENPDSFNSHNYSIVTPPINLYPIPQNETKLNTVSSPNHPKQEILVNNNLFESENIKTTPSQSKNSIPNVSINFLNNDNKVNEKKDINNPSTAENLTSSNTLYPANPQTLNSSYGTIFPSIELIQTTTKSNEKIFNYMKPESTTQSNQFNLLNYVLNVPTLPKDNLQNGESKQSNSMHMNDSSGSQNPSGVLEEIIIDIPNLFDTVMNSSGPVNKNIDSLGVNYGYNESQPVEFLNPFLKFEVVSQSTPNIKYLPKEKYEFTRAPLQNIVTENENVLKNPSISPDSSTEDIYAFKKNYVDPGKTENLFNAQNIDGSTHPNLYQNVKQNAGNSDSFENNMLQKVSENFHNNEIPQLGLSTPNMNEKNLNYMESSESNQPEIINVVHNLPMKVPILSNDNSEMKNNLLDRNQSENEQTFHLIVGNIPSTTKPVGHFASEIFYSVNFNLPEDQRSQIENISDVTDGSNNFNVHAGNMEGSNIEQNVNADHLLLSTEMPEKTQLSNLDIKSGLQHIGQASISSDISASNDYFVKDGNLKDMNRKISDDDDRDTENEPDKDNEVENLAGSKLVNKFGFFHKKSYSSTPSASGQKEDKPKDKSVSSSEEAETSNLENSVISQKVSEVHSKVEPTERATHDIGDVSKSSVINAEINNKNSKLKGNLPSPTNASHVPKGNANTVTYYKYNNTYLAEQSSNGQNLVDYCKNVTCQGNNILTPCCGAKQIVPQSQCKGEDFSFLLPIPGYSSTTASCTTATSACPTNCSSNNTVKRVARDNTVDDMIRFQLMHGISPPNEKEFKNALREINLQAQKVNRELHPELNEVSQGNNFDVSPRILDSGPVLENTKSTGEDDKDNSQLGQEDDLKDKNRAIRNYGIRDQLAYLKERSQILEGLRQQKQKETQQILQLEKQKRLEEENLLKEQENNLRELSLLQELEREYGSKKLLQDPQKMAPKYEPTILDFSDEKDGSYSKLVQQIGKSDGNEPKEGFFDRYSLMKSNVSSFVLPEENLVEAPDKKLLDLGIIRDLQNIKAPNLPYLNGETIDNYLNKEPLKRVKRTTLMKSDTETLAAVEKNSDDEENTAKTKNINDFKKTFKSLYHDLFDLQNYFTTISNIVELEKENSETDIEPTLLNTKTSSISKINEKK